MEGFDVVQLAHVEIYTPKPEETYWFFHDLLGMEETTREGQSVYLRGYEDFYHHSLKITEAPKPGLGHIAWRAASPEALERRVKVLQSSGAGQGWQDGDLGHGPAYRFTTPDGHVMELLWEVEYYQAPPAKRSPLKSRPSRRPLRGIPVRRLDHVNCLCAEVAPNRRFMMEQLGFKLREQKIGERGVEVGAWLSVSPLVHEIGLMRDATGSRGRFHHVAFWYGYPQHLSDLADACSDYGIRIEAGPGKHGTTQAYFMYVFEPGGTRVELFGDTGYLIFDPDWKTVVWDVSNESDLEKSTIWFGGRLPETFYTYGTPPVEG
ncbi:MAG: catechol 2,3-dioxygenase [Armatimonadota bacterium]|nr:catechol 2,3-dioxygenase [Armatimonadota bacterium]MDR7445181.1 catechol 2,3-dioxygenase [Armatimonadota bacterium]MDR7571212.1 catechol 2,3-dioxygenase [Armatimonadota bacterium]MDR7613718.1 catechol 2,3-dioxygenase [Armatimonadota bacterium]